MRAPWLSCAIGWLLLVGRAWGQDSAPTPDELEEIERALSADQDQGKGDQSEPTSSGFGFQSLNPDLAFIAQVAAAAFSEPVNLQTGAHDPTRNGFNLQQLELAVGGSVDPFFRFDANLVFSQFGVEIEEVYATTLALPAQLQVRGGQFLTKFGRLNSTHPHAWDFVDQPFALGRVFGGEGNRGLGVEMSWLAPLPWYVEVLGSVTEARGEATARSFFGATDVNVSGPLDFQFTGAVKQFHNLSDAWSLLWGLSGANGPNPTGHQNRTDVFGADLYLKYRPLEGGDQSDWALQAEVFYRRRQIPSDLLSDWSGYGYVVHRLNRQWGAAARYEFGSAATTRRGATGLDDLDPEWVGPRHRVSANVTFNPTEFSRLRLQGSVDLPTYLPEPIYAGFLSFEFNVGAHGAHTF